MGREKSGEEILVSYEELWKIGVQALEIVGVPLEEAKVSVEILLWADLRGVDTHGIQRLLMYVPRIQKGLMNPKPKIEVRTLAPAIKVVGGDNGLGQVVAARGMKEAIELAKEWGLSLVGCRDSQHFGAAAPYVLMACKEKMIGIAGTNAFPSMPPWGGLGSLVGNNPLAIGVPCEGGTPFVLDIAMSVSSRGRVRKMAGKKEKIPEGWALDSTGKPTTDPLEGLKGYVLPIGQHKGYGLAIALDILSGVLTGAGFGTGIKSLVQQWAEPQHIGHFFIVIDPLRFMPWESFSDRIRKLFQELRRARRIDPDKPVLIPGEPEARLEEGRRKYGIPLEPEVWENLKGLARGKYDYEIPRL
jgi:LDH2 family malate/lactate/ureidoglycolate dehydrogenase